MCTDTSKDLMLTSRSAPASGFGKSGGWLDMIKAELKMHDKLSEKRNLGIQFVTKGAVRAEL